MSGWFSNPLVRVFQFVAPEPEPEAQSKPEPAPMKVKPVPGTREWWRSLPPPRDDPDAIEMNTLRRSAERARARPPHRPNQEQRHWSGSYWYWR